MTPDRDPLDELADALSRQEPAAPRAGLRDDLLAVFSRETAPVRVLRVRRAAALAAAAAAVLIVALLLFRGAGERISPLAGREDGAVADLLDRIERLRREVDDLDVGVAAVDPLPRDPAVFDASSASPTADVAADAVALADDEVRALEATGRDPALLRLIAARTSEAFDREVATRGYRELLRDYPESPACESARARLEALAR